jgi:hypothetical protein
LGLQFVSLEIRNAGEVSGALAAGVSGQVDAIDRPHLRVPGAVALDDTL